MPLGAAEGSISAPPNVKHSESPPFIQRQDSPAWKPKPRWRFLCTRHMARSAAAPFQSPARTAHWAANGKLAAPVPCARPYGGRRTDDQTIKTDIIVRSNFALGCYIGKAHLEAVHWKPRPDNSVCGLNGSHLSAEPRHAPADGMDRPRLSGG